MQYIHKEIYMEKVLIPPNLMLDNKILTQSEILTTLNSTLLTQEKIERLIKALKNYPKLTSKM